MKIGIEIEHIAPLKYVLGRPQRVCRPSEFRDEMTARDNITEGYDLGVSTVGSRRPRNLIKPVLRRRNPEWREPFNIREMFTDVECIGKLENEAKLRCAEA